MPIYEYHCPKCEDVVRVKLPLDSQDVPECVNCEVPLKKNWNIGAVSFKGNGWGSSNN